MSEERKTAAPAAGGSPLSLRYSIERELGEKDFETILCTALEGGIGHWACLDNTTAPWKRARAKLEEETGETPTLDEIAVRVLRNGDDVLFFDAEEEDDVPEELEWRLTAPALVAAAKRFQDERTAQLRRGDPGNPNAVYDLAEALDHDFDAEDADTVIQYALFGELVYG